MESTAGTYHISFAILASSTVVVLNGDTFDLQLDEFQVASPRKLSNRVVPLHRKMTLPVRRWGRLPYVLERRPVTPR